ncbi:hypothetical protein VH86_02080 [Pantoea sp. BL1]|uniref:hypothetical protein n=1 Tax=Pantoea sp. BL1 TaxID=1628190 RepID=UPI0005F888A0|nr:hypothetical protein [Pantoea sp. BL1]KJV49975.1 hypothetical protein VH86_02080 [Pantoea sp. BL1]
MSFIKNVVFVIGPSGVGKSSIIKNINLDEVVNIYELDDVVYQAARKYNLVDSGGAYRVMQELGTQAFFILGMNYLFEIIGTKPTERHIIDVGAAFQNVSLLEKYSNIYNVICIDAKPKVSHERYIINRPKDPRDFFTHCSIEYSPIRIEIYNSATFTIDTSFDGIDKTINKFNEILKRIWNE